MRLGSAVPQMGGTVLVQLSQSDRIELATLNVYRNGKVTWLIQNTMTEILTTPDDNWWSIASITEGREI